MLSLDNSLLFSPNYAYINELRQSLFGRWFFLLDINFDNFILSELNLEKGFDSNNYLSRQIIKRGHEGSVNKVYDYWRRYGLASFNLYQVEDNFCLFDSSNSTSSEVIRKKLCEDLVNYCSLDSVAKNNIWLMSKLEWNDSQIDSLIDVRNSIPCKNN